MSQFTKNTQKSAEIWRDLGGKSGGSGEYGREDDASCYKSMANAWQIGGAQKNRPKHMASDDQTVKKGCAGQMSKSNSATCAVKLVFSKRLRRENKTFCQDCARKIVRFSAIRSLLPDSVKILSFSLKVSKIF